MIDLSPREKQVLQLLWDGLQRKEIALVMGLAEPTVKNYLHALYGKFHCDTSIQAVRRGLIMGFLTVPRRVVGQEEWP